jgi:uncharacterized linocin/CFP29 family protein
LNHLLRDLAPISEAAWSQIDEDATRHLTHFLAARKLVDFVGPHGWGHSVVSLGRAETRTDSPFQGVTTAQRQVLPLLELRRALILQRSELEAVDRGASDADLDPLLDACRELALAEDSLVFNGYPGAGIDGIGAASPHAPIVLSEEFNRYPNHVAKAVAVLKEAGVGGPYAIALGPRCYTGVIETTERGGYPILQHLHLILGGPVIWAPAVDGAIVLSQRGGDFELTVGQDLSIAYRAHDAESVTLELQESVAFKATAPEAAIALRYQS